MTTYWLESARLALMNRDVVNARMYLREALGAANTEGKPRGRIMRALNYVRMA